MNIHLKSLIVYIPVLISFLVQSPLSLAGPLDAAHQKNIDAYKDYYEGVKKLGPNATKNQLETLELKTMVPAKANWLNSVTQVANETRAKITQAVLDIVHKKFPGVRIKGYDIPGSKTTSDKTTQSKEPVPRAPREEIVLDGSNIPKELDLTRKKHGKGEPSPSPSPEVQVEGETKVDVIEFGGSKKTKKSGH